MDIFFQITLILLLSIVLIQDIKLRKIHIALPALILILGLIIYYNNGYSWMNIVYSLFFLVVTFFVLYVYISFKNKTFTNPFKQSIGIGDLLFFIAVLPYFSIHNYILFFISGMIFSMVGFLVLKLYTKTDLVPLAGLLALYVIILKTISYVVDYDLFFKQIF